MACSCKQSGNRQPAGVKQVVKRVPTNKELEARRKSSTTPLKRNVVRRPI